MAELFIEIFSEEIPARMQEKAGSDLSKALTGGLEKAGLTVADVQNFTGPRRLVYVAEVPLRSPDISEERKGPRVGAPERALEGFMKAAGLTDISQAEIKSDKKGEFYIAKIEKPGLPSAEIVKALLPEIMNNFPWPKSMKSGGATFRWVRPLQGIICLLGGDVVDIDIGGVTSGRSTEGHRRLGRGPYEVKDFADYKAQLEGSHDLGGHVMLGAQARKDKILTEAKAVCAAKGLELVEDIGLLNEVAGLAEWPVVLLGDMDKRFLELPDEVIRLTLKSHQKTFTVRDPKTGKLAPHYIIIANQIAPDGGDAIKAGNGKVISARLSDARFFQDEDRKHPLESYYDKLGEVVFHKKLGSIRDKAERVAALARELAPKVGADPDAAERAAKLAKCDLVTQTVIEFTSLEGQVGADMYRAEGTLRDAANAAPQGEDISLQQDSGAGSDQGSDKREADFAPHAEARAARDSKHVFSVQDHDDIAIAIEQHYKPKGPSDAVPTNPVAVAVALADKLDTLVGFWAIDEKPTGSKDPFALRRAALGVVRIILENGVRLSFAPLLSNLSGWADHLIGIVSVDGFLSEQYNHDEFQEGSPWHQVGLTAPVHSNSIEETIFQSSLVIDLWSFILDRLKVYLRDQAIRHDIIDAVLGNGEDDLVAIVNRVKALQDFLSKPDGENLLAGYKRAANILKAEAKKGELPEGAPNEPVQAEAAALYAALNHVKPAIESALRDENYGEAMQNLAKLRAPIDDFFDHVTVIDDDTAVMKNNLRLLLLIRDTARQIADFEAIQG